MSVGGDAHIAPARCNRKIARPVGDPAQRPVGADDPVRPWGNGNSAAAYRKNGRAPCGESAALTPTNIVRFCIDAFVFACAVRRADRGVRPYGCGRFRIGAYDFVMLYRAGGVEPRPYANLMVLRLSRRSCGAKKTSLVGRLFLYFFFALPR